VKDWLLDANGFSKEAVMNNENIKITARHTKISEEVKEYIRSKLDTMDRYFDRIKHIEVILDFNKNMFEVEIVVSVIMGRKIISKVADLNYAAAIDIVIDKIDRQLTKFKEIKKGRRKNTPGKAREELLRGFQSGLEQEDWF
jgi:putative sigma-54 modulation protein